ncbi:hypothetical protein HZS_7669, partial [Henneguya salminicola]
MIRDVESLFKLILMVFFQSWIYIKSLLLSKKRNINSSDTVLVLGACGSVGTQLIPLLLQYKCTLILIDRDEEAMLKTINFIESYKDITIYSLIEELTNYDKIREFFCRHIESKIVPNIIIFNAAISKHAVSAHVSNKQFNQVMENNVTSFVNVMSILMPHLHSVYQPRIVALCSVLSFCNAVGEAAYCASKSALYSYLTSIECENPHITCSAIFPAKIQGELFRHIRYRIIPSFLLREYSPAFVAQKVVQTVVTGKRTVYLPFYALIL